MRWLYDYGEERGEDEEVEEMVMMKEKEMRWKMR